MYLKLFQTGAFWINQRRCVSTVLETSCTARFLCSFLCPPVTPFQVPTSSLSNLLPKTISLAVRNSVVILSQCTKSFIRIDTETNALYLSAVTSLSEGTNVSVGIAASNFAVHSTSLVRNAIILQHVWRYVICRVG